MICQSTINIVLVFFFVMIGFSYFYSSLCKKINNKKLRFFKSNYQISRLISSTCIITDYVKNKREPFPVVQLIQTFFKKKISGTSRHINIKIQVWDAMMNSFFSLILVLRTYKMQVF